MATRRERVVLELEDNFSSGMARAAASTAVLDRALSDLDGSSVRVRRSMPQTEESVSAFGRTARRSGSDIDSFSGRLGLLASAAATLGPALVPLSTIAVPAVAGLTSGLGALAGAAGVTLLAFNGVGDSLGALNDYQLEPTAENLAKMEAEFDKLGASGVEFVRYLDSLGPELENLQRVAGDNMFPGMQEGLEELVTLAPEVETIVGRLSTTMGGLSRDAGTSLANDSDWQAFFDYLQTDAAPILDDFGRSIGNFVAGFANMMVGFDPLADDFASKMTEWSESFREWSAGLNEDAGFQEFINYIREQGPAVSEFFSSMGSAFVSLAKAVSPWGEAVLPVLSAVADAFSAIADSPIGPSLFTAGAAFLAFNKTMQLTAATMTKFGAGGPGGVQGTAGGVFGVVSTGADRANKSVRAFGDGLRNYRRDVETVKTHGNVFGPMTADVARADDRLKATRNSMRQIGSTAGRAAVPVAALGALSTGLADDLGTTNTATLALAGSMAGPWGSALGAAAGAAMDIAGANDEATASVKRLNDAVSAGSLSEASTALSEMQTEVEKFSKDMSLTAGEGFLAALSPVTAGSEIKNFVEGLFGESDVEELEAQSAAAERRLRSLRTAAADLATAFGANLTGDAEKDVAKLEDALSRAQPAMQELGITSEDLANESAFSARLIRESYEAVGYEVPSLVDKILAKQKEMNSEAGRISSVADAFSDIAAEGLSAAESADQLAAALQGVMQPGQNLVAAQDQWTRGVRDLRNELVDVNDLVDGNSNAAIDNRAAISEQVTSLQELMIAQADSGASAEDLARTMSLGREQLIAAGEAAGISAAEMDELLTQFGLTPELVQTVIATVGTDKALKDAKGVGDALATLDGQRANPKADLDDNATPKIKGVGGALADLGGRRANPKADLNDNATPKIKGVGGALATLGRQHARPTASVNDQASPTIRGIGADLAGLRDKTVTITTIYRTAGTAVGSAAASAIGAEGMIVQRGVKTFANGGMDHPNAHQPEIAQPRKGLVRVWGEEETQGESYIPWANDHRRPRAKSILEQTASKFGGEVIWSAGGNMVPMGSGASNNGGGGRQRMAPFVGMGQFNAQVMAASRSLKGLRRQSKRLEQQINRREKQVEREKKQRDAIASRRSAVVSDVRGSMTADLWGGGGNVFSGDYASGSVGYAKSQLRDQRARANQLTRAIRALRRKGLNGAALSEVLAAPDPLAVAQQLAALPASQVRQFESLYRSSSRAVSRAGRVGGDAAYGPQLSRANDELKQARGELRESNRRLNRIEKAIKVKERNDDKSRAKNAKATGKSVGNAAGRGARNKRYGK